MGRTLAELITAVTYKDFEPEADITTAVTEWLNDAYIELAENDFLCFSTSRKINTSSGDYTIHIANLPNYRKMRYVLGPENDIEWQDLPRVRRIIGNVPDSERDTGHPAIAWKEGDYIYLDPIPDNIYELLFFYFISPDRVTSGEFLIPPSKENLLVTYARAEYELRENNLEKYDRLKRQWENGIARWMLEDKDESEDSTDMITLQKEYNYRYRSRFKR
jgi:hypothetical protein